MRMLFPFLPTDPHHCPGHPVAGCVRYTPARIVSLHFAARNKHTITPDGNESDFFLSKSYHGKILCEMEYNY